MHRRGDIRNVYMIKHATGEQFYSKQEPQEVLTVVEYDDCIVFHKHQSLDDRAEVVTITEGRAVGRQQRDDMVLSLIASFLSARTQGHAPEAEQNAG